ncbi:MAG: hypothetical protein H6729_04755 [Deltaproteobacteria bacterium]|nr:hypothetical protein [Deltaproteobacteria bacterium]
MVTAEDDDGTDDGAEDEAEGGLEDGAGDGAEAEAGAEAGSTAAGMLSYDSTTLTTPSSPDRTRCGPMVHCPGAPSHGDVNYPCGHTRIYRGERYVERSEREHSRAQR